MRLRIMVEDDNYVPISPHSCYLIEPVHYSRPIYVGYTVNFSHRIRQHNGEIVGGAKKTRRHRPWRPVCVLHGFVTHSQATRFEARVHYALKRKRSPTLEQTINAVQNIIDSQDGQAGSKVPWPLLYCRWYRSDVTLLGTNVYNAYS